MSWVTAAEMRALEERAFASGVDAGTLMDKAASKIAQRLLSFFPRPGSALAVIGKGNNGGDAIAALEILRAHGWKIAARGAWAAEQCSALTRERLQRCGIALTSCPESAAGPLVVLDGLAGLGLQGDLRGPLLAEAEEIRRLRMECGARVVAVDLPSGLDPDSGVPGKGSVVADVTITVGVPKVGLLQDAATRYVGRLLVATLSELPPPAGRTPQVAMPEAFPGLLPRRTHDAHKGDAGRLAILAGSPGMSGAAELCAAGAVRGGAGLVTLFSEPAARAQPMSEVLHVHTEARVTQFFAQHADAKILGPGLGKLREVEPVWRGIAETEIPLVLDADALNLLAAEGKAGLLGEKHLITPHPGEFSRLAPDLAGLERAEAARRFVRRHPCTLLLKGAHTLVAAPGGVLRWNPTGHAGMASGGQGDVLAGVCGALLAAGNTPPDAAMLAAWLCGRAAERALTYGGESEESMTASDTWRHLGGAFADWRERRR